ncbi:Npun_R2821/Npun_R2822 family protein [Leptolyngbya iicbica]|uniref:Methionine synthase n=2 Tax=Cyanophyceae TaxID=3028117 RepID=A0A4Q7E4A7_9CYAN|nr:Npun_R2821/Npun_R2822 family protein [Leptolyngbya sp. LK]RZM76534.1 methionine synthase [Leptolyngbya sp. LK]
MSDGVYIVANDRVFDQTIALLSSLRLHNPEIPVFLVPFDEKYGQIWPICRDRFKVQMFPDLPFLGRLTQDIADIFPRDFLRLPNKMRKLSLWFGPLDHFVYIDADILLFQSIESSLEYLNNADFFCCDFQGKGRGLAEVFTSVIHERNIFTETDLKDIFNSGFWGSRKGLFTYEAMLELLKDCAAHREYFDFSTGTTDQPILNYLVLKAAERRVNITQANPDEPGSWAGSSHFQQKGNILYDDDRPLRYLHWAGCPMRPDGPYWELWKTYRFMDVSAPLQNLQPPKKAGIWERLKNKVKSS